MLIQEYLLLQKKHELEEGERTVVLMQIGTFYEIYSYDPTHCTTPEARIDKSGNVWNERIGDAPTISKVLNSTLTHENGNEPYSINNPWKVGFPVIAYEKNLETLLANDYVVLRYDQIKNGAKMERFFAQRESPTMRLDTISLNRVTNNIVAIYIEYQSKHVHHKYDNFLITTGVATVDVITGQNRVAEFYSKTDDEVYAVQELYRFLIAHYPRQLIIHLADMPQGLHEHSDAHPNPYVKHLYNILELQRFDRMSVHVNEIPSEYRKIPYQIEFFNKLFTKQPSQSNHGVKLNVIQRRNDRIIEELGLERMNYGRMAYLLLMQYCHLRNSEIIARLSKPDVSWIDENRHLILTHNAVIQLDLISPKDQLTNARKRCEIDSLMCVLDENRTHLGRRVLCNLLQNPLVNNDEITKYYDMVGEMLAPTASGDSLWLEVDRQLKELPDIARLQRKLEVKVITPKELALLYSAYTRIITLYTTIKQTNSPVLHEHMLKQGDIADFNAFMQRFGNMINFSALECCHKDHSVESSLKWLEFIDCPVNLGYYPDLDEQGINLASAEQQLQNIVDHLNAFLERTRGKKIEFKSAKKKQGAKKQDPTATILTTTTSKANDLQHAQIDTNLCGHIQVVPYNTSEKIITSDRINALTSTIDSIRMWMRQKLLAIYDSWIEDMGTKYTFYSALTNFVATVDLFHSYAKVSHLYNYYRPEILTGDTYVELREARHPIIERLIDGVYVTNDIVLGTRKEEQELQSQGKLLYGVNQVGKSSLVKLVPINIIMAQIGCFTPSHMKFTPITRIITRLNSNDNIFTGQSTFNLELTELRTILRQSDKRTLVVGDELCHGTETHSGMAITASAILFLIEAGALFMFATHMHELLNLTAINNLTSNIFQVCHLSISYDEATKTLLYDRKLKSGSGLSIYGLMVAKSLDLPTPFIEQANTILLEITGNNTELVNTSRSRYNCKRYMDICANCQKTKTQTQLHTHHIIEQKYANNKQLVKKVITASDGSLVDIGTMYKNCTDNIIVLCRDCHVNLHSNKQQLETVSTSNGTLVRFK